MSALVRYVPLGVDLDLTVDDLGHPGLGQLWDEIYRPTKWKPGVLQCPQCAEENPGCPEWMYLQMRDGKRVAVHKNTSIKDHPSGETDEHKAVNERTLRIATRAGLPAQRESASITRDRITDVLINGPVTLGVETQLSYQGADKTRRRTQLARRDGITPLWVTRSATAPLIDLAPWARYQEMPWHLIDRDEPMYVVGGVRKLTIERCGARGPRCPASRKCTGWHAIPEPRRMDYDDLIIRAATGAYVPVRRTDGRKTAWHWMSLADSDRLREIEAGRVTESTSRERPEVDSRQPSPVCTYGDTDRAAPSIRDTGVSPVITSVPSPMPQRPVIDLGARPPRGRCQHWIGSQRRYCNFRSAVGYVNGWFCDNHSPAAMAHLRKQLGA